MNSWVICSALMIDDRLEGVLVCCLVVDSAPAEDQLRILHNKIEAVTDDIDRLSFNTAISRMMEFTNFMSGQEAEAGRCWKHSCCC